MQRPLSSLSKRRQLKPIDYVSPDGKVTVHISANSEYNLATIYDLDILIYCSSVLMEHKRRGTNDIPQTLHVAPHVILRALKHDVGGVRDLLSNTIDRLQSTTVKTNIRSGDTVEIRDRKGMIRGMRIILANLFYDCGFRRSRAGIPI